MKKKLLEDLKEAMKEKNEIKKNAIQMVRAGILQIEKDKGIELTDEQIIELISKEVKKRKDSIADYEKGGREDLVNQINEEISYLEKYLPKQLTEEEITVIVKQIIAELGDINRFENIKQLNAFCGLDPTIVQSGKSINYNGPISKRGNRNARKILFIKTKRF